MQDVRMESRESMGIRPGSHSLEQAETLEVGLRPACALDDARKGFCGERCPGRMHGDDDTAPVGMPVYAMTPMGATQYESVSLQRGDEFAGRKPAQIVRRHTVTLTAGSFSTTTPVGNGSPDSIMSAMYASTASWM